MNNFTYSIDRKLKNSLSEFDTEEYYFLINRRFLSQKNYSGREDEIGSLFQKILKDSIKNSHHLFQDDFFIKPLQEKGESNEVNSENGENLLSFIIPALQNVFSRFYINPPSLFIADPVLTKGYKNIRLEIFELSFDSDEFLEVLAQKLRQNINILDDFKFLDHYSKIIEIIIDDYVSGKVKEVQKMKDLKSQLRYLKIKKGLQI